MAGVAGDRYALTQKNASNAPDANGVYQIEDDAQKVLYVGSGNIRARLLSHLNKENAADTCIFQRGGSHYRREQCANYRERERQLVLALRPPCNSVIP